jgi:hypothetical protein
MTSPDRGGRPPTSRKGPSDDAEPLPPVSLKRDLLEDLTLQTEGRVAVMSSRHRPAGRTTVVLDDLVGEPVPRWKRQAAAGSGPQIEDLAQLIHLVRLERVVAPLALSLIAPVPEGVTCVPIFDAPTNDPVLARPPARKSNALRSFLHAALSAVDTKHVPTSKIKKKDRS